MSVTVGRLPRPGRDVRRPHPRSRQRPRVHGQRPGRGGTLQGRRRGRVRSRRPRGRGPTRWPLAGPPRRGPDRHRHRHRGHGHREPGHRRVPAHRSRRALAARCRLGRPRGQRLRPRARHEPRAVRQRTRPRAAPRGDVPRPHHQPQLRPRHRGAHRAQPPPRPNRGAPAARTRGPGRLRHGLQDELPQGPGPPSRRGLRLGHRRAAPDWSSTASPGRASAAPWPRPSVTCPPPCGWRSSSSRGAGPDGRRPPRLRLSPYRRPTSRAPPRRCCAR